MPSFFFFFFNDTATTEIYTLSLHDALPILPRCHLHAQLQRKSLAETQIPFVSRMAKVNGVRVLGNSRNEWKDRKSTRLNSSHSQISYAVFCLKKKTHATSPRT